MHVATGHHLGGACRGVSSGGSDCVVEMADLVVVAAVMMIAMGDGGGGGRAAPWELWTAVAWQGWPLFFSVPVRMKDVGACEVSRIQYVYMLLTLRAFFVVRLATWCAAVRFPVALPLTCGNERHVLCV